MSNNSLFNILNSYLKGHNIKIPTEELKLQLLSHPSYPSLHAITGVLDHFNIDSMALEVPQNKETFDMLPEEFISFVTIKSGSEFVAIKKINNGVQIHFGNRNKEILSFKEFINVWNGLVVGIENKNFENSIHNEENKSFVSILYVTSLLLLLTAFIVKKPTIFESIHFLLSVIGIIISILIVKHELGFQSKTVDKICSSSKQTSCDEVLNSKGASFGKNLKLSDISFIYFSTLAISWIILLSFSSNTAIISLITLVAIPITFYSIFYQYRIVKKWCPLCLAIVTVLWLQGTSLFLDRGVFFKPSLNQIFILLLSFTIISSVWLTLKQFLIKKVELEKLKVAYFKFKRNFTLFNAVYQKSPELDTSIDFQYEIILGNKNAAIKMVLVTNPSCYYCKQAHSDIEDILSKTNDIKLTIRFSVPQDNSNISYMVAYRLIEIYNTKSIKTCESALKEAYHKDVNLEQWIIKWKKSDNMAFEQTLKDQNEWCTEQNINFTPGLILNERQFPKEYERRDLVYFLDDLIEQTQRNTQKEEIILN